MIKLNNIYKSFADQKVIEKLSYTFPETGIVRIIGSSGQGKTTLLRIIAGMETPDQGEILGTAEKRISCVFQENRLLPWLSAKENITFAAPDKEKALGLLEVLELSDSAEKKPEALSGGMQRRISIARALAYGGDVFLLDEPYAGLDLSLRNKLSALIRELAETSLVILISHEEETDGENVWELSL